MTTIVAPKYPVNRDWQRCRRPPAWVSLGYEAYGWRHPASGLCVISAVEVAKEADRIDRGPEYHVSISKNGNERCTAQEAQWVLEQFGLDGAEEDNHVPHGIVRNFWRPVAERLVGMECACKASEPAIVEDKGDYIWRGAEHA